MRARRGRKGLEPAQRIKAAELAVETKEEPSTPWLEELLSQEFWEELDVELARMVRNFRTVEEIERAADWQIAVVPSYIEIVVLARLLLGKSDKELRLRPLAERRYKDVIGRECTRFRTTDPEMMRDVARLGAWAARFSPEQYAGKLPQYIHEKVASGQLVSQNGEEQMEFRANYRIAAPGLSPALSEEEMELARSTASYNTQGMLWSAESMTLMLKQLADVRLAAAPDQWAELADELDLTEQLSLWAQALAEQVNLFMTDEETDDELTAGSILHAIYHFRIIAADRLHFSGPGQIEIIHTAHTEKSLPALPPRAAV